MFDKLPSNDSTMHASMDSIRAIDHEIDMKIERRGKSVNPN